MLSNRQPNPIDQTLPLSMCIIANGISRKRNSFKQPSKQKLPTKFSGNSSKLGRRRKMTHNNDYWKQVILEIELASYLKSRSERIKNYDLSVTLPKSLRKRVAKILPYEFDEYDRNVYIDESTVETPKSFGSDEDSDETERKKEKKKKGVYNESTCSEIERLENEFPKFDLKLEVPVQHKKKAKKRINWTSTYVCKQRKERVQWESKIYDMERSIWEKTLDEQAEQLMDASAERFTEWLNMMGDNHESDISKAQLKSLFSIEGDRKLLASIQTEPKEVKAIAKTVADKWNLPEMAIELKYERYIEKLLKNIPKVYNTVAFGRCIPYKERPWLPSSRDVPIATVFPEEILSGQKLFKGIGHLRSTKALVEFFRKRPNIEKPRYLIKSGIFNQRAKTSIKQDVPLYELLKLKF